jgi:hypothetical protein
MPRWGSAAGRRRTFGRALLVGSGSQMRRAPGVGSVSQSGGRRARRGRSHHRAYRGGSGRSRTPLWAAGEPRRIKNLAALNAAAPGLAWPVEIAGDVEHPDGGVANFANVELLGRLTPAEMARRLASAEIFAAVSSVKSHLASRSSKRPQPNAR